jgi:XapX domain-containing protein
MKPALGIIFAFAVGFACRYFAIPSPAPAALTGALLVMAMTVGFTATDRIIAMRARRACNRTGSAGGSARPGDTA